MSWAWTQGWIGRLIGAGAAMMLACLALSAQAQAIAVSGFAVNPDTTAAGGHPNLTVSAAFSGGNVKNMVLHFPPGLIGNPLSATVCSQAAFASHQCPSSSVVGSASSTVAVLGLLPTTVHGQIFDLQPMGSEPARLGILLKALPLSSPTDVSLQSVVSVRAPGDYGLDATVSNMPDTILGLPLTVQAVSLTLNAAAAHGPFMSNPTSCVPAPSKLDITAYDGTRTSSTSSFTPTACAALPFSPTVSAVIGGKGRTGVNQRPTVDSVIAQPPGQSTISSVRVVLPATIGLAIDSLNHLCTTAQYTAGRCPASSRVGTATAITPLLATPLTGPVILAELPSGGLPALVVKLSGAIPVTLAGITGYAHNRLINTFTGIPDVPLSRFELKIFGGRTGLLANIKNLCRVRSTLGATLKAHSGRSVSRTVIARVAGCR